MTALNDFLSHADGSPEVLNQLAAASGVEEVIEIAKSSGFALTPEDFPSEVQDISDDQLTSVNGGFFTTLVKTAGQAYGGYVATHVAGVDVTGTPGTSLGSMIAKATD